jgi:hypothetical protein
MIDVKSAVNAACQYLESLQDFMGKSSQDLRLEEVELSEDRRFWLITLGFEQPVKAKRSQISSLVPAPAVPPQPEYERVYKLFKVNSETGEVEAMKIREG